MQPRMRRQGEELPPEDATAQTRRRGELLSPAGEVLANIWVVDESDVDGLRTLRPVHDHAGLASVGCFFDDGKMWWEITGVAGDGWTCKAVEAYSPAQPPKAGDA